MSTLHLCIDDAAPLAELLERLDPGDEVSLERGDQPLARLIPAPQRPAYVGLYGNHPYELRERPVPHPPELGPDDFMD